VARRLARGVVLKRSRLASARSAGAFQRPVGQRTAPGLPGGDVRRRRRYFRADPPRPPLQRLTAVRPPEPTRMIAKDFSSLGKKTAHELSVSMIKFRARTPIPAEGLAGAVAPWAVPATRGCICYAAVAWSEVGSTSGVCLRANGRDVGASVAPFGTLCATGESQPTSIAGGVVLRWLHSWQAATHSSQVGGPPTVFSA